jgi:hypothetical protein
VRPKPKFTQASSPNSEDTSSTSSDTSNEDNEETMLVAWKCQKTVQSGTTTASFILFGALKKRHCCQKEENTSPSGPNQEVEGRVTIRGYGPSRNTTIHQDHYCPRATLLREKHGGGFRGGQWTLWPTKERETRGRGGCLYHGTRRSNIFVYCDGRPHEHPLTTRT